SSATPSRASPSSWRKSAHLPSAAPACPSTRLSMRQHQGVSVLVGCDRRDTDHCPCSRPPDDPISRHHRAPPMTKVMVSAISLSCPIGGPSASDTVAYL